MNNHQGCETLNCRNYNKCPKNGRCNQIRKYTLKNDKIGNKEIKEMGKKVK